MTAASDAPRPVLLAYGFRVFFLLAGAWSAVALGLWIAALAGLVPPITPAWHAHEMLFAVVGAAAAGFLLTAVANWTATPPIAGGPLAALAALWLGGRAAMLLAGVLPAGLVAAANVAFFPVLALALASRLLPARNRRNYPLLAVLLLLAAAQGLWHIGRTALAAEAALLLIAALIVVIGGRITPAFTANHLRARGEAALPRDPGWLAGANVALILATGVAALAGVATATGWLALATAAIAAVRLLGWRTTAIWREPLLAILHVAWLWLVAGLALRALADLGLDVPRSLWIHALGAGAIGTILIGVMTRVSLGHTGRPLVLQRGGGWLYAGVVAAALLRVLSALPAMPHAAALADLAGLLWMLAWLGFVALFAPILLAPRADGRPG